LEGVVSRQRRPLWGCGTFVSYVETPYGPRPVSIASLVSRRRLARLFRAPALVGLGIVAIDLTSRTIEALPVSALLIVLVALGAAIGGLFGGVLSGAMCLAYGAIVFNVAPAELASADATFKVLAVCVPLLAIILGALRSRTDQAVQALAEANTSLANAVEGISRLDASGAFTQVNAMFARVVGHEPNELIGMTLQPMVQGADLGEFERALADMIRAGRAEVEVRVRRKDGAEIHAELVLVRCLDDDRAYFGHHCFIKDVTPRRRQEAELRAANQKLSVLLDEQRRRADEIAALGEISEALQSCATEHEASEVISRMMRRLFPHASGALYLATNTKDLFEASGSWGDAPAEPTIQTGDCWALRRGKGHEVTDSLNKVRCEHVKAAKGCASLCVPLSDQNQTLGMIHFRTTEAIDGTWRLANAVAEQITLGLGNIRLREQLRSQAMRDPLTGLLNRRAMEEAFDRELRRAKRKSRALTVLMIDIDHFKGINDRFGHQAGDLALSEVGRLLQRFFRADDVVCRLGGEEFLVILPEASVIDVERRAEELLAAMRRLDLVDHGVRLPKISVSIGLATLGDHGNDAEQLLRTVDAALYRAKREGRDRLVIAEHTGAQVVGIRESAASS
jgi:diguanylate cyclase (GGDEF)-like protein/PAS domain S-box-containing protein